MPSDALPSAVTVLIMFAGCAPVEGEVYASADLRLHGAPNEDFWASDEIPEKYRS